MAVTNYQDEGIRPVPIDRFSALPVPRVVLTDIDDTLTDGGRLGQSAYTALWRLHDAGMKIVPVTGRPAGWCDLIVREWPVAGVVGENGAFAMFLEHGRQRIHYHPNVAYDSRARLDSLKRRILAEVPGSRVSSDQPYRLFDLAIDFAEEEPDLGLETAYAIRDICREEGAEAKVSSIHVNAWYGEYSKVEMSIGFLSAVLGIPAGEQAGAVVFVGDSPNDEPLFEHFPVSVGVASIRRYIGAMRHLPAYITSAPGGAGFAEVAAVLLSKTTRALPNP